MAYNRAFALFLIALVVFAATNPLAHAGGSPTLNGLTVGGRLCCTATGNCPGQGCSGVAVLLKCPILGVPTTVGHTTTTADGSFNITIPAVTGLVLGLPTISCFVSVKLPLDAAICPLLSTTSGVLTSTLQVVGTVLTSALGLVECATITVFVFARI